MSGAGRGAGNAGRPLHSGPKEATMHDQTTLPALPTQDGVEFRHVAGWPGYAITSRGDVWGCRKRGFGMGLFGQWKALRVGTNWKGYRQVGLSNNRRTVLRTVHSLVLEAFVGPRPAGMDACHNNGDPSDNRAENLRWDTRKGNFVDRDAHGTTARGEKNGNAILNANTVKAIRSEYVRRSPTHSTVALARKYGIPVGLVGDIVRHRTWKHV
jgi:hypothetical protein